MTVENEALRRLVPCNTIARSPGPPGSDIPFDCVSPVVPPEAAYSWNELDGVWSVDPTGEPLGWRSVERDDVIWQLRLEGTELLVSRGRTAEEHADWWVSLHRGGESIVDDHRVRVCADGDLGEALAAVLTAIK